MPSAKRVKTELRDTAAIARCAREFGVIGDATRMKICYLLCRHPELPVGEIARAVGVSISAVSHSLKKMKALEMVAPRREQKQIYYCLCKTPLTRYLRKSLKAGARRQVHPLTNRSNVFQTV